VVEVCIQVWRPLDESSVHLQGNLMTGDDGCTAPALLVSIFPPWVPLDACRGAEAESRRPE
jgi:hypothetical protein